MGSRRVPERHRRAGIIRFHTLANLEAATYRQNQESDEECRGIVLVSHPSLEGEAQREDRGETWPTAHQ
jgi:hypothetical protein